MNRNDYVLTSLMASKGKPVTPVQIQKLLFLSEKMIGAELAYLPRFDFQPYHYGPFDKDVYDTLDELAVDGLVEIFGAGQKNRRYGLTDSGIERAHFAVAALPPETRLKLEKLAKFVTSLSFCDLVSVIYREYPEMRVNSVFEQGTAR